MLTIAGLIVLVLLQWVLIWKLVDRLLFQAHIPLLGPVVAKAPESTERPDTRKKIFSVKVPG